MNLINILISTEYIKEPFSLMPKNFNVTYFSPKDLVAGGKNIIDSENIHCLCIRSQTKINNGFLMQFPNLKLIISATAGMDHVDIDTCKKNNIGLKFLASPSSKSAAEHTLMLILSLIRNIKSSQNAILNNKWKSSIDKGMDLSSLTVGVIGFGRVGSLVSKALSVFGAKVLTCDPYKEAANSKIEDVISMSDLITLHVPETEETKGMVDKDFISKMKKGSFLVNTSRGSVVEEYALIEALKSNHLFGAALDVFESEPLTKNSYLRELLASQRNVILTPHAGSWTESAFTAASKEASAEIVLFFKPN